jgi:hypothetical protein
MDDIGNLVYILVFVIWFLYKTFWKRKKKPASPLPTVGPSAPEPKPQERSTREATPPPVTFEDVLRELTGAPPVTVTEPEKIDETPELYPLEDLPANMEETSFEVFETPAETQPAAGPVLKADFSAYKIRKEQGSKAAREVFKMLKSKNGLKQAIILKEILDRPYK